MSKRTWIWPLSWYQRIRELEAENAALRLAYKDLDAMFRAEAIAHTTAMAGYAAALTSMAADAQRRYTQR